MTIDGLTLRYVATGEGPSLLLLHTLRTQLDMFQRTVHALAQTFRVYAVDLPGHGYSDIPETDLEPELFVRTVGGFLDELDLEDVVVVGESIGATIGLLLAARGHPRVKRVVAINPYDYDRAEELEEPRSRKRRPGVSRPPTDRRYGHAVPEPVVENATFLGGVRRRASFPPGLLAELTKAGNRRGYTRAFHSLVRVGRNGKRHERSTVRSSALYCCYTDSTTGVAPRARRIGVRSAGRNPHRHGRWPLPVPGCARRGSRGRAGVRDRRQPARRDHGSGSREAHAGRRPTVRRTRVGVTFFEADRLTRRVGEPESEPPSPADSQRWIERMRHFLTVDAAGCWVAVAEGEVVAFAISRIVAGFGSSQPTASCLSTRAWGSAGNCWTRRLPMLMGRQGMLVSTVHPGATRRYRLAGFMLHPLMRMVEPSTVPSS